MGCRVGGTVRLWWLRELTFQLPSRMIFSRIFIAVHCFLNLMNFSNLSKAQRRKAVEVLCVPLVRLQDVASAVADEVAHVQEVFIFMTGKAWQQSSFSRLRS